MTMPMGSPVLVGCVDFFMMLSFGVVHNRSADGENGRRQPMSGAVPLTTDIRSRSARFVDSRIFMQRNGILSTVGGDTR